MVSTNTPKFLKRFIINRKGTAEVIGSVLFIIILIFAFSNIYLWHDNATKTMNTLLSDKLNSQIELHWLIDDDGEETSTLIVTNTGGISTSLSRLWIVTTSGTHRYANLESTTGNSFNIAAGNTVTIVLNGITSQTNPIPASWTGSEATVSFNKADGETFTILTSLGNMASPKGLIKIVNYGGGGGGGTAPVGSVIVADFQSFSYYPVTGQQNPNYSIDLNNPLNGYSIQSAGKDVSFGVVLTNNDPNQRTINLNAYSQMFFINTKNPNNVGYLIFYLVNVDATGKISQNFPATAVNLPYNVPTRVYFASEKAIVSSQLFDPASLKTSGQVDPGAYPLNLALLGKFDNTIDFGQNIPFVSIYIAS
jgi:hypothetical protein